jgi:tRNA (mo5U34)-methyltransferase
VTFDSSSYQDKHDLSDAGLTAEIESFGRPWFHTFEFANDVRTPGNDPSATKLAALALPDLSGLTVLDIGAVEGYFSFSAEALGAKRVLATDHVLWNPDLPFRRRFDYMKNVLGSSVEAGHLMVEECLPETIGTFDVVLFLGVLYHAPNMMQYLNLVRSVTKRVAVVETLVDMLHIEEPIAAFYPAGSVNNDASNWWGPNIPCVEQMLSRAGFSEVRFIGIWSRVSPTGVINGARAVWHAFV